MEATSRASARFFAAFYRWNCASHAGSQSNILAHGIRRSQLQLSHSKHFVTTRRNAQAAEPTRALQKEEAEVIAPVLEEERSKGQKRGVTMETVDELNMKEKPQRLPKGRPAENQSPVIPRDAAPATDTLRHAVRTLMRNVPHPVVVLTAAAPHPHEDMPLGIAVSSFNTVTLDPPTISFNIRHPSQTLDAIRRDNGRFRIHFLSRKPQSARIAHSFTRGNHQETYQERRRLAEMDTSGKIFSKAAHIKDAHVTAAMQCELTQEMTVGDHIIAVARVSALTAEEPIEPLLMYVQGRYIDGSAQLPHHRRKPDSHK